MNIRKLGNAVLAVAAAGVLLVVLPVGLWVGVGWPLPAAVPSVDEIGMGLRSGIDPQLLIKSLAVIVWIVWAQLVAALTVEVVAALRGRPSRRIPVMPGLQVAASRLVAAFAVVAATAAPLKAPAALPLAPPVTVEAVAYPQPLEVTHRTNPTPVTAATERTARYTTQRFDTLWGIAEQTLGDGRRWREIRSLNPQVTTADGEVASGVDLALPADAKPSAEETGPNLVTVEAGDSFWSIAQDNLARSWGRSPNAAEITTYWRQVIDVNHDRLVRPHDPDLIYPGQIFQLPNTPDDVTMDTPTADGSEVVVEAGDSLWSIARQALTETWDRSPTDTETSRFLQDLIGRNSLDNPDVIHPGQTLRLPPIPTIAMPPSEAEPSTTPDQEPAEGDWEVRTDSPSEHDSDPQPPPDPEIPTSDDPTRTADSRSTPDNVGETPPTVTDPPTAQDRAASGTNLDAELDDAVVDRDDDGDGSRLLSKVAAVAGMGVFAAALVALIDRLRRIQFQHRRPNTVPTPPPESATPVEVTLRSAATPTATELIDAALRAIGRHAVTANTPPPDVAGVHLSERDLRVLLWTANADPPAGWGTDDNNAVWVLPTDTDLTHLHLESDGVAAPYPTLVTAGQNPDGQLLVDLEFIGALQVAGAPGDVEAACYTIAAELAASTIADWLEVICVGFGHDLAQLERVQVVDDLDSAVLDRLEEKANSVVEAQLTSLLEGRMGPGGDWWYPVVVIDPAATAPEGADRLLATAASGRAVAAVVGYPTSDSWCFHLEDGTVRVEPLGHELSRRDLTPREQEEVTKLITAAKDLSGVPADQAKIHMSVNGKISPDKSPSADGKQAALFTEEPTAAGGDVEVRVLGTVSVEGAALRGRTIEVCAYLALHRNGVDADRFMEALWPNEAPDNKRLNRTVSRTRRELGARPDDEPYIPRAVDGLYRPGPNLRCDLDRFTEYTAHGDQTDGDEQIGHLKAALELVSGTPFSGPFSNYAWVWSENFHSFSVVAVDEAAHRLSELALGQDTPDLATWSARQGLLSSPTCEACYRNLMRAAVAQDNHVALEAIFRELVVMTEEDDGADATLFLDPETVEFYQQHSRRHS